SVDAFTTKPRFAASATTSASSSAFAAGGRSGAGRIALARTFQLAPCHRLASQGRGSRFAEGGPSAVDPRLVSRGDELALHAVDGGDALAVQPLVAADAMRPARRRRREVRRGRIGQEAVERL